MTDDLWVESLLDFEEGAADEARKMDNNVHSAVREAKRNGFYEFVPWDSKNGEKRHKVFWKRAFANCDCCLGKGCGSCANCCDGEHNESECVWQKPHHH